MKRNVEVTSLDPLTTTAAATPRPRSARGLRLALPLMLALAAMALIPAAGFAQYDVIGCNLVWTGPAGSGGTMRVCERDNYLRPAYPLTDCPGAEKDGALCYPFCREGYNGIGPVCWQNCPAGYTDDGAFCRRNAIIISADNRSCPWYDRCGLTFARGCSRCPAGYRNDGCTCRIDAHIFAKDTYTRPGGSLSCAPGREQIGALCYGTCKTGYSPDGLLCVANQETCRDVPVDEPRDPVFPFCYRLTDPASAVTPCFTVQTYADNDSNARELAQCQCANCGVEPISCANLSGACLR